MARQGKPGGGSKTQGGKALAAAGSAGTKDMDQDTPVKKKTSIPEFFRQVRQETAKVTWPTRNETFVTTVMVFIMVIIAAIFFFLADTVISNVMRLILSLGG